MRCSRAWMRPVRSTRCGPTTGVSTWTRSRRLFDHGLDPECPRAGAQAGTWSSEVPRADVESADATDAADEECTEHEPHDSAREDEPEAEEVTCRQSQHYMAGRV